MSIEPIKIDPDDIARYLLYQQFYYGEDRIYGRTKDRSEYIEGAGKAIEDFYSLIVKSIKLIEDGHIERYLEFFNKNVHKIPIETIMDKYKENKDILGPEMNRRMTLNVIIGESLLEIHRICFDENILKLIEFILEKRALKSKKRKDIKKKIKSLYGQSNPDIGMIYSLSFMEFMGKKVGYKDIVVKCEELLKKYFGFVLEALE